MTLELEFDVSELKEAFNDAERKLEPRIKTALQLGADLVVREAKTNHDYTDRTGALTNSIMADDIQGSFASGMSITVSAGAKHSVFVEEDTKAHIIRPKNQSALRWPVSGGFAFAKEVKHPGTTGTHFMANALEAKLDIIEDLLEDATADAFEDAGFTVD